MKALIVGFPKSGTSTLQTALEKSGWLSLHWRKTREGPYVGLSMYKQLFAGQDPFAEFSAYDAVTECNFISHEISVWPQLDPTMLRVVRIYHPECLFILNYRDPEQIADSISRWRDMQHRLDVMGAPGLPPGYARNVKNLAFWISECHARTRERLASDPKFFEYDITSPDAPSKLEAYLGIKLRWWGVANKNKVKVAGS